MAATSADIVGEPETSGHGHLLSKVKDSEPTASSSDALSDGNCTHPLLPCLYMNDDQERDKPSIAGQLIEACTDPQARCNTQTGVLLFADLVIDGGGRSPPSGQRIAARKGHHSRSPQKQRLKLPPRNQLDTGGTGAP